MMAQGRPSKGRPKQLKRSHLEDEEIKEIEKIILEEAPARGSNPLAISNPERPTFACARKFEELPISRSTKDALKDSKFIKLTAIQRAALPHALCGRDVLGAAKTGSGKTLAFLIPLVERLYRSKWGRLDGLGALVISPTRELALQIFEELRRVGARHEFSAGLLIGGKDVDEEAARLLGMNILVATPGRLLQHMDETPGFDASTVQVLVLDEADRILDMGFTATLNAIIANLPRQRQTLLFSATQTKSVSSLARLSLKEPEYVAAHAEADAPTPVRLEQAYMECPLQDKLDILWSFIKSHIRARVIIFLSTCKQVRFIYEAFRRLRPGTPLRALHGRMSQYKRMGVYAQFCDSKAGVLFATDIAARGLDFPGVDWVVQADCPEDVAAYIHRVGRTARYTNAGKGLLLLTPSEREVMLEQLSEARIQLKLLKHNPAKVQPVTPALQALLSKDAELKEIAQRALVSYLRSTFLQPNRKVFDVTKLPVVEFALSMGLSTVPKLRFLKKGSAAISKEKPSRADGAAKMSLDTIEDMEEEGDQTMSESSGEEEEEEEDVAHDNRRQRDSEDDDFLVVKKRHAAEEDEKPEDESQAVIEIAKRPKRLRIRPGKGTGTRVVFDDEGKSIDPMALLAQDIAEDVGVGNGGGLHTGMHATVAERVAAARAVMSQRDQEDKAALKALRKSKRDEKRAKRLARENGVAGPVAVLDGGEVYSDGGDGYSSLEEGKEREFARGHDEDLDLVLTSDTDSDGNGRSGRKVHGRKSPGKGKGNGEVAHLGMVPIEAPIKENKKKKAKEMSLAEQEALALHLLRGGG